MRVPGCAPRASAFSLAKETTPVSQVDRASPTLADAASTHAAATPCWASTGRRAMPAASMPTPASLKMAIRGRALIARSADPAGSPPCDPVTTTAPSSSDVIDEALSTITANIECSINLPEEPSQANTVLVEVNGQAYPEVGDCASQDGWVFTNPNGPWNTITLCGAACQPGEAHIDYACE